MPPRKPSRTDDAYNASVKAFYRTIEDYDWNDVADSFRGPEAFLHRFRERHVLSLLLQYAPGRRALDVGCGTGLILRHLPPGSLGVDLNPRHLARAGRYAPNARLLEADAEALPANLGIFDVIVCTEVLEHLVHPERALDCMRRLLSPGGIIIGSTPRWSLLWRLRWLSSTHYHNEPFHNEFTERELRGLFRGARILLVEKRFFRSTFFFVVQPDLPAAIPSAA
jgi:2-polyprenyl-3-methyl-5-hydroxy-6-metoxy-1,4-benzoquinol methylase